MKHEEEPVDGKVYEGEPTSRDRAVISATDPSPIRLIYPIRDIMDHRKQALFDAHGELTMNTTAVVTNDIAIGRQIQHAISDDIIIDISLRVQNIIRLKERPRAPERIFLRFEDGTFAEVLREHDLLRRKSVESGIKLIKRFVQVGAFVVLIGVIAASGITSLMESRAKVQRSRERGAAWNKMTEKWRDYGERHADWKRRYALARARLNRAREQGDINDIGTSMEEVSALLEEAKALRAYYRTLQEESDATADAFEREQ